MQRLGFLVCGLWLLAPFNTASAQSIQGEIRVTEAGGESQNLGLFLAPQRYRMDMENARGRVSMIQTSQSLVILHHERRMYMRAPAPTRGGAGPTPPPSNVATAGAEPCRWRRSVPDAAMSRVGRYRARRVEVYDGERLCGTLWLSTQAPVGLLELWMALGDRVVSAPGRGPRRPPVIERIARARREGNVPAGRVVQMLEPNGKRMQLMSARRGTISAQRWRVPEGYTEMSVMNPAGMRPRRRPTPGIRQPIPRP